MNCCWSSGMSELINPACLRTATTLASFAVTRLNDLNFSMNWRTSSGTAPLFNSRYDLVASSNRFDATRRPPSSNAATPTSVRTTEQLLFAMLQDPYGHAD